MPMLNPKDAAAVRVGLQDIRFARKSLWFATAVVVPMTFILMLYWTRLTLHSEDYFPLVTVAALGFFVATTWSFRFGLFLVVLGGDNIS